MSKNEHPHFERILDLLLIKHRQRCEEYGLQNLNRMGATYMMARIVDKSGRIENFLKGKLDREHVVEELEDTAVCAILALCLIEEGKVPLYIFEELKEA